MARRGEHNRTELRAMAIAAAEHIVDKEGVAGLTARKVAASMGYTVGTLYLVFDNLDALLQAVNTRTLAALREALRVAGEACNRPRVCLKAMGMAHIRFATEQRARWSLLYARPLRGGQATRVWVDAGLQDVFAQVERTLLALADGREASEVRLAAQALWSGVHGICVLGLGDTPSTGETIRLVALVDTLIEHFLSGYVLYPMDRG